MKNSFNILKRIQFNSIIFSLLIISLIKLSLNIDGDGDENYEQEVVPSPAYIGYTFRYMGETNIQVLPFVLSCTLPVDINDRNKNNFENLLFNLQLKSINDTSILKDLEIKATITDLITNCNNNIETLEDNKFITANFDLSTHTVALNINKTFQFNNWNLTKNENNGYPLLCVKIYNKNQVQNSAAVNITANTVVTSENKTEYSVEENVYVNDKLEINEIYNNQSNNFKLYNLTLKNDSDDTFQVDFSSNFALSRGIYVSFLDSDDIKSLSLDNLRKNSSKVDFIKSETNKGSTYHFEFSLKNNEKNIYLCVFSSIKKKKSDNQLPSVNYVFKYSTYNSKNKGNLTKYELNHEVEYKSDEKTKITIKPIKINSKAPTDGNKKMEIYVRKIKTKFDKELLDTIGLIQSKYELVNAEIKYEKDNIEINIPKIDDEKEYYSILTYLPEDNEMFVYNTIHTTKIERPIVTLILTFLGALLTFGVIVGVIIFVYKHQDSDLRRSIMATSFSESGAIRPGNEETEDEDLLD